MIHVGYGENSVKKRKRIGIEKKMVLWIAAVCMTAGGINADTISAVISNAAVSRERESGHFPRGRRIRRWSRSIFGEPKYVYWETDTVGRWSSVSKAHEYQVKLYLADNVDRDEEDWRQIDWEDEELEAVMTKRTTELSCDFSDYMNDLHSYFFVEAADAESQASRRT